MTKIVILGLARQGVALARYLAQTGAQVMISDMQPAEKLAAQMAQLSDLPVAFALGGHPPELLDGADLLCLSGGVSADLPLAQEARRRGVPLSNDSQIFFEVCPTKNILGITGSAGKTTTTTLVGRMSAADTSGRTWVGGNIGHPLIADIADIQPQDRVVMELSSFQLEIMTHSPHVAAVLNITPNHLDRHGTMAAYTAAKSHILLHQTPDDVAVLNLDDSGSRDLANLAHGRIAYFSRERVVEQGAYLSGERLLWRWDDKETPIATVSDIQLRGRHNVLNVLAACAISGAGGVTPEAMRAGLAGFTGVEHRLEFIRALNGAKWYNDSIATAPERVVAALNAFDEPIVWLAGGRDKKLPWAELAHLVKTRVKYTVLFGEAGPLIEEALRAAAVDPAQYTRCAHLAEAVPLAAQQAGRGEVVLLSPGCTGYDEFKDFAERGQKFKEWVRAL